MQLERLKSRGIDIAGIDPEDPVQVHEAMRSNLGGGHTSLDIEQLAAQHVPKGPPPIDEAAARRDIERAWEHMGERSKDGVGLVNVELGEILARPPRRSKGGSRSSFTKELGLHRRRSNSSVLRRLSFGPGIPSSGFGKDVLSWSRGTGR